MIPFKFVPLVLDGTVSASWCGTGSLGGVGGVGGLGGVAGEGGLGGVAGEVGFGGVGFVGGTFPCCSGTFAHCLNDLCLVSISMSSLDRCSNRDGKRFSAILMVEGAVGIIVMLCILSVHSTTIGK